MLMQVAEALRQKRQRFLAEQLPNHQLEVTHAAGIVIQSMNLNDPNECQLRSTHDMQVDQSSESAGAPLTGLGSIESMLDTCRG